MMVPAAREESLFVEVSVRRQATSRIKESSVTVQANKGTVLCVVYDVLGGCRCGFGWEWEQEIVVAACLVLPPVCKRIQDYY